MSLWLPSAVANAEREQMVDAEVGRQIQTVKHLNKLLRERDHRLELVWVGEKADYPGLVPGRWHIVVKCDPPAPWNFEPVVGPDDSYVEPDSGIFDMLDRMDLRKEANMKRVSGAYAADVKAREARRDARRAALREEFQERLKAKLNPGIRFGGQGWRNTLER